VQARDGMLLLYFSEAAACDSLVIDLQIRGLSVHRKLCSHKGSTNGHAPF
jgi:hypothetical protein